MKADKVLGVFRQCGNPDCRFRYPDMRLEYELDYCPKCGEPSRVSSTVLAGSDSESIERTDLPASLVVLLDNIRSVYNVGSIFRTCEGLGINEIYLTGITPTPEHPRLAKTGLGAEEHLPWHYHRNASDFVDEIRKQGFQVIGLECTGTAVPLQKFEFEAADTPTCLIVGNERLGIDPDVQEKCDQLVCIPMQGVKESLNVSVAFAIAAFYLTEQLRSV